MQKSMMMLGAGLLAASTGMAKQFYAKDYGITPEGTFTAADVSRLMDDLRASKEPNTLYFDAGCYRLTEAQSQQRTWFISNHDQRNPRRVFLPIEAQQQLTIEARDVFFEAEVPMIFVGVWESSGITLRGMAWDYLLPVISQLDISAVDAAAKTVTFTLLPEVKATHEGDGKALVFHTPDLTFTPNCGILFEADGKIAYRTSDLYFPLNNVTKNDDGSYTSHGVAHSSLAAGQHMATRPWWRPMPGLVVSDSKDVTFDHVTVHYADGMGLLAQSSENLTLRNFRVVPNQAKGRFFSTQADATHFSGCKGIIRSEEGAYTGMMDDAINVHGTYLRLTKRVDERTIEGQYMHPQAYGFSWGVPGDQVTFIRSNTMEMFDEIVTLESITPIDQPTTQAGAKTFRLTFKEPLPEALDPATATFGIENLTWTPEVLFKKNYVANNRARGALFSTPQKVVCIDNIFDHISGCGVLLCGDCNGWYETGACKDVLITRNIFINNLTSLFQFTEAVISIYPEIPNLQAQQKPLHKNVTICDNLFIAFDKPLVYAKSVDGLVIKNNQLLETTTYAPYLNQKTWLRTEKCIHVDAEEPTLAEPTPPAQP